MYNKQHARGYNKMNFLILLILISLWLISFFGLNLFMKNVSVWKNYKKGSLILCILLSPPLLLIYIVALIISFFRGSKK